MVSIGFTGGCVCKSKIIYPTQLVCRLMGAYMVYPIEG